MFQRSNGFLRCSVLRIKLYLYTCVVISQFMHWYISNSNQTQQVDEIVDLLFRATDLAINITRVVFDNNTEVESILSIVEEVLNTTGLQDNVTCILTQFLANENVQALFSNVALENLVSWNILNSCKNIYGVC